METATLTTLSDFILNEAALIIDDWIDKVMRVPQARELDRPTLIDHMPDLIRQLGQSVRKHEDLVINASNGNGTCEAHGSLRFQAGFDVVEVMRSTTA
jgi:hypothetical protein